MRVPQVRAIWPQPRPQSYASKIVLELCERTEKVYTHRHMQMLTHICVRKHESVGETGSVQATARWEECGGQLKYSRNLKGSREMCAKAGITFSATSFCCCCHFCKCMCVCRHVCSCMYKCICIRACVCLCGLVFFALLCVLLCSFARSSICLSSVQH